MDELDRELSACARSGDRDAVGRLLERIGPRLRSAVLSAGVPPDEAEDAVQEAFARALAHWRDARGDEARAGWLAAIARHVAVDWRRRRDREQAHRRELDEDRADDGVGGGDDAARGHGSGASPASAIPGLAADAFALLELRYRDGLSGREIAARLDLTLEAAKKRLQRARAEALARLRGRLP
jgi:RNA polymerase sigma-70 factor (ECF subfamily)